MKFEIEIDGVNSPIEDVETAINDILYNQLDMELGVDYKKFKVNVNNLNDKRKEKIVKEETVLDMDDSDYAFALNFWLRLGFLPVRQFWMWWQTPSR